MCNWILLCPPPHLGQETYFSCASVCLSDCPSQIVSNFENATPHTVLAWSFWDFAGVFVKVWRCAWGLAVIIRLIFCHFFCSLNLVIFGSTSTEAYSHWLSCERNSSYNVTGYLCWMWNHFFSSPEPKAPRWAISIPVTPASVVRPSSVRPSTFSNIFSSETTGPIELKFHMETP